MIRRASFVLFVVAFPTLTACGAAGVTSGASASTVAAISLPSTRLFSAYSDFVASADVAAMRQISVDKLLQDALATTTDAAVTMPDLGVSLSGLHSKLQAQATAITSLSRSYATIGDLMDAQIIAMPKALSLSAFQEQVRNLGRPAGLGLAGDSTFTALSTGDTCQKISNSNGIIKRYSNNRGDQIGYYNLADNPATLSVPANGYRKPQSTSSTLTDTQAVDQLRAITAVNLAGGTTFNPSKSTVIDPRAKTATKSLTPTSFSFCAD